MNLILDKKFGKWNLWRWMFYALWHSLVLTLVGFFIFTTADSNGKMADLFTQGNKLILNSSHHHHNRLPNSPLSNPCRNSKDTSRKSFTIYMVLAYLYSKCWLILCNTLVPL